MIVIPIIGGAGNQLFQIAFAKKIQSSGIDVSVTYSILNNKLLSKLLNWTMHPNARTDVLCNEINIKIGKLTFTNYLSLVWLYFIKRCRVKTRFDLDFNTVLKKHRSAKKVVIPGYFQTVQHLSYQDISYVAKKYKDLICNSHKHANFISAHVRRGDFKDDSSISADSYKNIFLKEKMRSVAFFSNDLSYVSKHFSRFGKIDLISNPSLFNDFCQISNSTIIVSSNSTFSYMASCASDATQIYFPSSISNGVLSSFPFDDRYVFYEVNFGIEI